jgi:ABC-2 type transport system ATP-binding protein
MIIRAENLTARRGRRVIFKNLSVEFGGGVTILLGPNGAGKSTLLRSLATLGARDRGSVSMDPGPSTRRGQLSRIGFMPQEWGYFAGFSAQESVAYSAWLKGFTSPAAWQSAASALAQVGLSAEATNKVARLSGGMKRRVGLAEALVHKPDVLLLDEPTVGLDPQQRSDFRSALRNQDAGASVILSTHLIDDAMALADRVVVIGAGRVRFDGTLEALRAIGTGAVGGEISEIELGYIRVLAES